VTSVEVPYSIACALPTLSVLDITNEVGQDVGDADTASGIAFVSPGDWPAVVRVCERETGFFQDVEALLGRLVPFEHEERARLLALLLGPRTEQIPFSERRLCLGRWQRVLLVTFEDSPAGDWQVTLVG
jgi:thiamine phosphate synthase YjbQ (UPF0047 family)